MKSAKYQWKLPKNNQPTGEFVAALKKANINQLVGELLWQRGIDTPEKLHTFLTPTLDTLHDPFLFFEMDKAVSRINMAIELGQKILIYGDYDADGITSGTIMKEALELLGAEVECYLPNRFTDGYGPNIDVYQEKIAAGTQLIVTVDNGVSGHAAIDYANSQGVDVVVTDHHELPDELPNAFAIIHPRHPAGQYPFGELAGVGVAFKVACALLDEVPMEFLDLVAIGTIADMVSLTDENRSLVVAGLAQIKQGDRLGLLELLQVSGVKRQTVDATSIGFAIAPRLNAIGRLADPNPAVTLLTTFDDVEAKAIAQKLDQINNDRKQLVESITAEALNMLDPDDGINIIAKENWHQGVLGIVAGKILQATGKPTIILTINEAGVAKGSGRSTAGLNMFQMLNQLQALFLNFGGHHAACGVTLEAERISDFRTAAAEYLIKEGVDLSQGETLSIAAEIKLADVNLALINSLQVLEPFGMDNPLPKFLLADVQAVDLRQIGGQQQHLKFSLTDQSQKMIDGIGFGFGSQYYEMQQDRLSVVGQLSINEWNGQKKPQLMLEDFCVSGNQLFDFRPKKTWPAIDRTKDTLAIYFEEAPTKELAAYLPVEILQFTTLETFQANLTDNYRQLLLIDCPTNQEIIPQLVQASGLQRIIFVCQAADDAYLDGLGTREQYGRLYQLIQRQKQLDVRYKLPSIANYLKIPPKLLIFMIQVFFDLKFVTIDDGVLRFVPTAEKKALDQSDLYQKRQRKIKSEEFLLLSDLATLKTWITTQEETK